MSGTDDVVKDLNYYIEHPDEMPTDPEAIAKIMAEAEGAVVETKTDPTDKKDDKGGEKKDEAAPASAAKPDDAKPKGVLTKDGEHFLPYAELERRVEEARRRGEEEARQAAETAAKEVVDKLQAELKARDEKVAQLESGKKGATVDPIQEIGEDLMSTIEQEYPTLSKPIKALFSAIKQRDEQIHELTASVQQTREAQTKSDAEVAADEVQALIDANSDLSSWQKDRPRLFDLAIDTEAKLMGDKKWVADHPELVKDDAKRYEHVVELVKRDVGLPAASPKNDKTDLDRKAEEAVAAAAAATPRSLSEIKGGSAPAQNLEENLEGVSTEQLAASLLSMSEEQRARWFARLG